MIRRKSGPFGGPQFAGSLRQYLVALGDLQPDHAIVVVGRGFCEPGRLFRHLPILSTREHNVPTQAQRLKTDIRSRQGRVSFSPPPAIRHDRAAARIVGPSGRI